MKPCPDEPADHLDDHPRVRVLSERFRQIDVSMRDLPIYNPKVTIEAIGFRPFGADALLGVLVTPWFMNLTLLPVQRVPMDMAAIGRTVLVELPAGSRTFAVNGDDVTGLYKAYSSGTLANGNLPASRPGRRGGAPDAGIADDASNSGTQSTAWFPHRQPRPPRVAVPPPARVRGRTTRSWRLPLGNRSSNRFACTRPSPMDVWPWRACPPPAPRALPAHSRRSRSRIPHSLSQLFPLCGTAHAVAGMRRSRRPCGRGPAGAASLP